MSWARDPRLARRRFTPVAAVLVLAALSAPLAAQGTLSTQGLGFPPGQLSTKAVSMGGSIGEADPLSPLNPAALGLLITPIIVMQAAPEFRELRVGNQMQRTSVARFPLFLASMPFGTRWSVSLSASTLLDRTWGTTARDAQVVSSDTVGSTVSQLSEGSVVDLRVAAAYTAKPWLRLGLGGHAYSGRDGLRTIRAFDDTVRFATDTQFTTLSFGGSAVSFGVQTLWPKVGAVGVTYRRGGTLSTYQGSQLARSGSAPDHFGVSAVYLGITGMTLAARAATDQWSRLKGLSSSLIVHEGWDVGVGADVLGPRFGGGSVGMRAGARWRTLPFSASGTPVRERTWSGGFGFPLASQRAELNIGALRATRTGPVGTSERAWTISTGFSVRP